MEDTQKYKLKSSWGLEMQPSACARPWVPSPAPGKKKKKEEKLLIPATKFRKSSFEFMSFYTVTYTFKNKQNIRAKP